MSAASLILTVSSDEGDNGAGITLEVVGYTEPEILESLVRVAEAIIQRQMREVARDVLYFDDLSAEARAGMISMQARLALIDMLTDLDFVSTVGVTLDL